MPMLRRLADSLETIQDILRGALGRLHDQRTDERGDIPGWVLIAGMTVGLALAIFAVARPALTNLVTQFFSGISFK